MVKNAIKTKKKGQKLIRNSFKAYTNRQMQNTNFIKIISNTQNTFFINKTTF